MIRSARPPTGQHSPDQHATFLKLLPTIERHLRYAFRRVPRHARDDVIQDGIATAFVIYCRLVQRHKIDRLFATPLARFAILHVHAGRRVGTSRNRRDLYGASLTGGKGPRIERLDRFDAQADRWLSLAIPASQAPIPVQVAYRIDLAQWLSHLSPRHRQIAKALGNGDTTSEAARRFRVSRGRISQLRREFYLSWCAFQGEIPRPFAAQVA